jgi:hypothetical protein
MRAPEPYTALSYYIHREFSNATMQRWYPYCSDSAMAFLEINSINRIAQRAFVQNNDGETYFCVWDFPDCPGHHCEVICWCMACEGIGAWGEYGPCDCIAHTFDYGLVIEPPDPFDDRYVFHKIPLATIWPYLNERERVDTYDVDPCFVYEVMPNAQEWYFRAREVINEADGKNASKNARRIRREKIG